MPTVCYDEIETVHDSVAGRKCTSQSYKYVYRATDMTHLL